jgi:hypothetical protein
MLCHTGNNWGHGLVSKGLENLGKMPGQHSTDSQKNTALLTRNITHHKESDII